MLLHSDRWIELPPEDIARSSKLVQLNRPPDRIPIPENYTTRTSAQLVEGALAANSVKRTNCKTERKSRRWAREVEVAMP
jgi:hypothetical protein